MSKFLKVELLEWATRIFGENEIGDLYSIREEVAPSKDPKIHIKKITLFVKKHLGMKKDWGKKEVLDKWRAELKLMAGEHLKLSMDPIEGIGRKYVGGMMEDPDKKEHYIEQPGTVAYNFQLNIEIVKRVRRKANAGTKRTTIKKRKQLQGGSTARKKS